ncbi:hypothetical protein [Halobaculum sp. D14]|uniref:hypothetical protein n=1 Tax=Halobaculum sp. D14 TaxID=3421642 RepID=UPI003EB86E0D
MSDASEGDELEIPHEEISVVTHEGEPALRIHGTTIVLRTFLDLPGDGHGDRVPLSVDVDADGDNGAWWNLTPADGDLYPMITLQPEVSQAVTDGGVEPETGGSR